MAKSELLLLCPAINGADGTIDELREHGFGVHPCCDFKSVCQILETRPVVAILALSSTGPQELDAVLAYRLQHHRELPVFFVAVTEFPNLKRLLHHTGVVFLPSSPKPSDIDRLLISTGAYAAPPWQRFRGKVPANMHVTVRQEEFPIRFQEAREKFEALFIERVLRVFHGNVSRTAEAIDMGRRNVQVKIQRYKIPLAKIRKEFSNY